MEIISFTFWSHAESFLTAASIVKKPGSNTQQTRHLVLPAYYLVGHSIELSLKSYLAAKGHSVQKLKARAFGHDLMAILGESRRRKLGREVKLSANQVKAIELLNVYYKAKTFEYLKYGNYRLPEYAFIHDVASYLLKNLARYASNSPFNKQLQRTRKSAPLS